MAFTFDPSDRTLARGTRRIALEQVDHALDQIDRPGVPQGEAVHEIRKGVKKLRALLRLVRPGLSEHRALDALLRDAARRVAALRDAAVLWHTLDALAPGGLPAIRAAVTQAPPGARDAATDALAACRADLVTARGTIAKLALKGADADVLRAGLVLTMREAQTALHFALRESSATSVHNFRKRVKDHLYHARLLTSLWPVMMGPHAEAAEQLAETLGLMNDIAVFRDALAALDVPAEERADAEVLARVRDDRLSLIALPLAARLFAGRPDDVAERWCAWWAIWRAEA